MRRRARHHHAEEARLLEHADRGIRRPAQALGFRCLGRELGHQRLDAFEQPLPFFGERIHRARVYRFALGGGEMESSRSPTEGVRAMASEVVLSTVPPRTFDASP